MFSLFSVAAMPKQNVGFELFYDGSWHDVAATDDVFTETPIRIQRGQGDESAAFRPAQIIAQLDNEDDQFRTSNPMSPLYGKAGRNTPVRVKVGGVIRGTAEASTWKPDQTQDFRQSPPRGKAWVDLEAGGLLQRISQWTEPLRSPFYEYNAKLSTSVGYFPMEDPVGARSLYTPTPGARTDKLRGLEFQSQTRFAGSAPMIVLPNNPNTLASGFFTPGVSASTAGWQISFCFNFGSIGSTGSFYNFAQWLTTDGTSYFLSWLDGKDLALVAETQAGVSLINTTFVNAGNVSDWNRWNNFIIKATHSAGTTTISIYWNTEGSGLYAGPYTATFSGGTSTLYWWRMQSGGAPNNVTAGHVTGTSGTSQDLLDQSRLDAFNGYAGERTGYRIFRLLNDRGILVLIRGDPDVGIPMGPQPVDSLPKLLEEIVRTEDGLLFDEIGSLVLIFTQRDYRYSQTPQTLIPTDLPALPKEVTDDLNVHNVVTASQRDGGDATVQDDTGPLGTQPPPDGAGEYRQTVDINIDDETLLPDFANWWLRRGTVDLPRFPQVAIDLTDPAPGFLTAIEDLDIGDVIEITGMREYTIRLYVLGYTETIGSHTRSITFTCAPDQQFVIGIYDDGIWRWDTKTTTLATSATSTATSLSLTTANANDVLTTAGGSLPYDLVIEGERVRVTAMTAPAGSGPYTQTATVTRSINGVVKALPSGAQVNVYDSRRWGL